MNIRFTPVALPEIHDAITAHLVALPSAIDSFLEDHIAASRHYRIHIDGHVAGFTSLHNESLITQFVLDLPFAATGQSVYARIKKLEKVQSAFVPTGDEFFLSHALDKYRQLTKQAYFFAAGPVSLVDPPVRDTELRLAEREDVDTIRAGSGDFFGEIETYIQKKELFVATLSGKCVGFGILDRSELAGTVGSIGMFVLEAHRRQGVGTEIVRLLRQECEQEGLRPVAGCWYYNHLSKKTLERGGMFSQTRLLKIDY